MKEIFLGLMMMVMTPTIGNAFDVGFNWSPNDPTEQIDGYKIYYKETGTTEWVGTTGASEGDSPIDIPGGGVSTFTVHGIDGTKSWDFTITAYRTTWNGYPTDYVESDYAPSLTVVGTVDQPAVSTVLDFRRSTPQPME